MEVNKTRNEKLELAHEALHQLLEEKKERGRSKEEGEDDDEEEQLLSKLLSQLESLERDDAAAKRHESSAIQQEEESASLQHEDRDRGSEQVDIDEIARDLRRIRRQNLITHCLLSALIVVTAVWQFSEASMLLTVKEKLSHPMRAVGDMVKGALKGKDKKPQVAAPLHLSGAVHELPHVPLPALTLNNKED